jgi:Transcription termination factor
MDKTREMFAKFIYMNDLVGTTKGDFLNLPEEEMEGADKERLEELMDFYLRNKREIIEELEGILVGWRVERLLNLDRAAILAGICEILLGEDPEEVIYDYGTFARVFSGERSPSFVMGVLKSYKEVKK